MKFLKNKIKILLVFTVMFSTALIAGCFAKDNHIRDKQTKDKKEEPNDKKEKKHDHEHKEGDGHVH